MRARAKLGWLCSGLVLGLGLTVAVQAQAGPDSLQALVGKTSQQVSKYLDEFSDVKCIEQVEQDKFGKDGKIELKQQSDFDYLVILTNAGGQLSLNESRLPLHPAVQDKKNRPLLVTNGFATLFLVFHPYYAGSFEFSALPDDTVNGHVLRRIGFQHVRGTRSLAALALRGREYPLELSGTAWIDPQSGSIVKIVADIGSTLEDVGLKTLHTEVEYAPVTFRDQEQTYWFPEEASVEVETARQHWRNIHRFHDYKQFSVSTEEKVASQ